MTTATAATAAAVAAGGASLLREWDDAPRGRRKELLAWLAQSFGRVRHAGELESHCGADVALLLPRVLSWLNKCATDRPPESTAPVAAVFALDEQLACLELFLKIDHTRAYLDEFEQADGRRILLRVLELDATRVTTTHRSALFELLRQLIQRGGEATKAAISQLDGERVVLCGALAHMDTAPGVTPNVQTRLWSSCRGLLLELMTGNPLVEATHRAVVAMLEHEQTFVRVFGAQLLRERLTPTSFFFDERYRRAFARELVPHCLRLLQVTTDARLEHEGLELVHALLQDRRLTAIVCADLAQWVRDAAVLADPVDPTYHVTMASTREYEMFIHLRTPFVHAAQSINTLLHSTPWLYRPLVDDCELLIPVAFVLVAERPHSLKWHAALTTLHLVFGRHRGVAQSHLAQLFGLPREDLAALSPHVGPEHLARVLVGDATHHQRVLVQFYDNGWRRSSPQAAPHPSMSDGADPALGEIEAAVDAAVRGLFVTDGDLLPIEAGGGHDPLGDDDDDDDDYDDDDDQLDAPGGAELLEDDEALDAASEQRLRERLERHFAQFRRLAAALSC